MLKRFATIRTQFKAALRRANLPDIRFHDLRHSAATILLAMDVNIKVIQELLGHASITTTLGTYSHVTPSMQSQAMHLLDPTYHQFRHDAFNKAKNAQ